MMLEDRFLVDGEGWSILTDIIGVPTNKVFFGALLEEERTIYKFYSINHDRFFTVPKEQVTYKNFKQADCCHLVESESFDIGEKVLFWDDGPKLCKGEVKSIHGNTVTLKSDNRIMDVNDLYVVQFKHEFLNIEGCVSKIELRCHQNRMR